VNQDISERGEVKPHSADFSQGDQGTRQGLPEVDRGRFHKPLCIHQIRQGTGKSLFLFLVGRGFALAII
jgi:hypothetical protein